MIEYHKTIWCNETEGDFLQLRADRSLLSLAMYNDCVTLDKKGVKRLRKALKQWLISQETGI